MMSDINDRGGNDPNAPGGNPGATGGPSFGTGQGGLPGRSTIGQDRPTPPGGTSDPGAQRPSDDDKASPGAGSNASPGGARAAAHDDRHKMEDAVRRETAAAKDAAQSARDSIKDGAAGLASSAKERLEQGVESGKAQATSSLGDFAAAVRKASDELGQRDQSMAASLMREVASGIEQASNSIKGSNVQDLGRSIAGFARRQPTAFLVGATLAGVALGRLARASGDHPSAGRAPSVPSGTGAGDRPYSPPSSSPQTSGSPQASRARTFPTAPQTSAARIVPAQPSSPSPLTPASTDDELPSDVSPTTPADRPTTVTPNESGFGSGSFPPAGDRNVR